MAADPEVIDAQSTALARPEPKEFLAVINRAIESKAPIETMERLYALFEKQQDREAQAAFNEALARVQAQIPVVKKDRKNTHAGYQYATLDAINDAVMPIAGRHGFCVTFSEEPHPREDYMAMSITLAHSAGHSIKNTLAVPIDGAGLKGGLNKTATQACGSTTTYLRRALVRFVFNISTEDDPDLDKPAPKATVALVSEEDAEAIVEGIKEVAGDMAVLLGYFKIDDIRKLPANRISEAQAMIDKKRKKMKADSPDPKTTDAEVTI